ncbi:hypothetical protein GTG23_30465 [Rhodococcus hoagii]|nr:hypothetical protein [Prescottella equi]
MSSRRGSTWVPVRTGRGQRRAARATVKYYLREGLLMRRGEQCDAGRIR